MGGSALKNTVTRRFLRDEYLKLEKQVQQIVGQYCVKIGVPRYFPGKESFGDCDLLVVPKKANYGDFKEEMRWDYDNGAEEASEKKEYEGPAAVERLNSSSSNAKSKKINPKMTLPTTNLSLRQLIPLVFNSRDVFTNSSVTSCEFQEFQIDLIECSEEEFEMQMFFFSYSDMGSIIGGICTYSGLKFGHAGLWGNVFYQRETLEKEKEGNFEKESLGKIVFSKDVEEICAWLTLPLHKWTPGFTKERQMFDFICECRLFEPNQFLATLEGRQENRNRANRRPVYGRFYEYLRERYEGEIKKREEEENEKSESVTIEKTASVSEERTEAGDESKKKPWSKPQTKAAKKKSDRRYSISMDAFYEALEKFGKRSEYDELIGGHERSLIFKKKFHGKMVQQIVVEVIEKQTSGGHDGCSHCSPVRLEDVQPVVVGSAKDSTGRTGSKESKESGGKAVSKSSARSPSPLGGFGSPSRSSLRRTHSWKSTEKRAAQDYAKALFSGRELGDFIAAFRTHVVRGVVGKKFDVEENGGGSKQDDVKKSEEKQEGETKKGLTKKDKQKKKEGGSSDADKLKARKEQEDLAFRDWVVDVGFVETTSDKDGTTRVSLGDMIREFYIKEWEPKRNESKLSDVKEKK